MNLDETLAAIVGARNVLSDPDLRDAYEHDATGRYGAPARVVVRPADTAEVAAVLCACFETGTPVVTQGGNTGLVGGNVPRGGEVLLSLKRLDALGEVDAVAAQVTAGAGVTLEAVQQHARAAGLAFGVDFAARSAATVGGMIATDAGGAQALRHGTMRAQVAGLEAVLADGRVLTRMSGLLKDTAGYNLPQLLIGTEGTLAVTTRARLKLVPAREEVVTALLGLPDTPTAVDLMVELRGKVDAIEVFYAEGMRLVTERRQRTPPFEAPVYVLVEGPLETLADALPELDQIAVADDTARREALWEFREALNEVVAATGVPHKLDVTLPLAELAAFEPRVREVIERAAPGALTVLWGHLGDGNLHVNVLGPDAGDLRVDEAVLELVAEAGGSISAEHGVGVTKRRWLSLTRSAEEIEVMRALKLALDPRGILNPGVVLPD